MSGLGRNASEEFLEEIIYGTAYRYITPWIRQRVDEWIPDEVDEKGHTQPSILKEAVESSLNVLVMGVLFMIIRYEEAFLDVIFGLARGAKTAVLVGGKNAYNALKSRVTSLRGVRATSRAKNLVPMTAPDARAILVASVDAELRNIVVARQTQYMSAMSYTPAAQMHDTAVQKEMIYQQLGAAKANTKIQLSMFKLFSGTFSEADKQTLKAVFKSANPTGTYKPDSINIEQLNKMSEFMFVKDSEGRIIGLTRAFLDLLNGLSYLHNKNP